MKQKTNYRSWWKKLHKVKKSSLLKQANLFRRVAPERRQGDRRNRAKGTLEPHPAPAGRADGAETLSFSKDADWHDGAIHWFFASYNSGLSFNV
jgi:hypothetical protein